MNLIMLGQPFQAALSVSAFLQAPLPYESIDWIRQAGRMYVVLDPNAAKVGRTRLLYLTEAAYLSLSKVCLSNNVELEVIALPEDTPETIRELAEASSSRTPTTSKKSDQKSPPLKGRPLKSSQFFSESSQIEGTLPVTEGMAVRATLYGVGARLISPLLKEKTIKWLTTWSYLRREISLGSYPYGQHG